MRLVRFAVDGASAYGVLEGAVDLAGEVARDARIRALESDPWSGAHPSEWTLGTDTVAVSAVRLLAPVPDRAQIVGIGRNYAAHAAELGNAVPTEPLVFLKASSSVIGPDDQIVYPPLTQDLQYEGELVVVIGRPCRGVDHAEALDHVLGFTVGNDVTARDLQRRDVQFTRGKGFDTFCPLGPWIETDLDVSDVGVRTTVNDEVRQDGRTCDLIFDVATLISHVSSFMSLRPGDAILTGTPEGVGPMRVGDTVQVSVEGLGTLCNSVT